MAQIRLQPDTLAVESFELGIAQPSSTGPVTDPVQTDPNTWEDTCINMCPTDDTCTRLGCTRTNAL